MELLSAILASTVIATLISSLINFATGRNKDSIDNITIERKNWRDEIRHINLRINQPTTKVDVLIHLSDLKVRISAYGIYNKEHYLSDGHIWEFIR